MSAGERRVCLLTGAGGLLGSTFCRRYAADYDIVAVCRRRGPGVPTQYEDFVDPLDPGVEPAENALRAYAVYADLTEPGQVERVVDVALARFGRVDLLVNNAAHIELNHAGLVDTDTLGSDLERAFAMNVAVPAQLAARLAEQFWKARPDDNRAANRNVVNVSSLSGSKVYPFGGQAAYSASKAALNHLTRHQGAEFGRFGVRANAIAPNSFPTSVPTEDVAAAIVQLDRQDVTGRILAVDAPD